MRVALCCRDGGALLRLLWAVDFRRGLPAVVGVDDFSGDLSTLMIGGATSGDLDIDVT